MNDNTPAGVPAVDVDPYSDEFLLDPYPFHAQLRAAGPVVWIPKYGIYAAARHEAVRAVFADHATYISSAGVGLANFHKEERSEEHTSELQSQSNLVCRLLL